MTGEVQSQLKHVLADIREKTGVSLSLTRTSSEEKAYSIVYCGMEAEVYSKESKETVKLVSYLLTNMQTKQPVPEKGDYLKSILLGEGDKTYVYRFMAKYQVTDGECFALDVQIDRRVEEAFGHIVSCLSETQDMVIQMGEKQLAVVKFTSDGQSSYEFGQFLCQSLYEEIGVRAKVCAGCEVKSFTEISASYHQAATATRMSKIFSSKGDVHTYREFLLVKMLEDVPQEKLQEYMEQFRIGKAQELFSDEEMISTAEEFLDNSLNISETSRNLYMHRNTLMYRLDKIERLTGLNLRNFSDAVTFRVITILHRLLKLK